MTGWILLWRQHRPLQPTAAARSGNLNTGRTTDRQTHASSCSKVTEPAAARDARTPPGIEGKRLTRVRRWWHRKTRRRSSGGSGGSDWPLGRCWEMSVRAAMNEKYTTSKVELCERLSVSGLGFVMRSGAFGERCAAHALAPQMNELVKVWIDETRGAPVSQSAWSSPCRPWVLRLASSGPCSYISSIIWLGCSAEESPCCCITFFISSFPHA